MVQLPKNCKVHYYNEGVQVKMTYATTLSEGVHDGITVFSNWKGRRYFSLTFDVKYQNNMPMIVREKYFQHKKKAMLFNRGKKIEDLQKQMGILSNSSFPGTWDILHLKGDNQMPPPPTQIELNW